MYQIISFNKKCQLFSPHRSNMLSLLAIKSKGWVVKGIEQTWCRASKSVLGDGKFAAATPLQYASAGDSPPTTLPLLQWFPSLFVMLLRKKWRSRCNFPWIEVVRLIFFNDARMSGKIHTCQSNRAPGGSEPTPLGTKGPTFQSSVRLQTLLWHGPLE